MTTPTRLERSLPSILGDLAAGPTPEYIDDVLSETARKRQRPGWTFPERWFPMAEITSRSTFAPRLPWRTIAVALLVIALLVAGTVAFIGAQQPKLPPPFGVAGNGLIAYAKDGDIFTVDPSTGVATAIITGPDTDIDPEFSLDGTRLLFARQRGSANAYDILVANPNGSGARVVTADPLTTDERAHFTSDGSAVIATLRGRIQRIDLSGGGTKDIAVGRWTDGTIRATDDAILFENDETPVIDLWVMQADGSDKRLLLDPHLNGDHADLSEYRWSPDGTKIAYICSDPESHVGSYVCVMNADGSDPHQLTHEGADWWEQGLQWSPDGRSIAFDRWQQAPGSTGYLNRPIGTVPVDGGRIVEIGPTPAVDSDFVWSPDGTTVLTFPTLQTDHFGASAVKPTEIEVATGEVRLMPFDIASGPSWQRAALD